MSRRYGRNQRRAHRERIAELERRLRAESVTALYLPEPGLPYLGESVRVITFVEELSGSAYDVTERKAILEVEGRIENYLHELYEDRQPVEFRGHRYLIVSVEMPYDFPRDTVTVNLIGVV